MRNIEKCERNDEIVAMRYAGDTYGTIARRFGISVNRARQVYEANSRHERLMRDGLYSALMGAAESTGACSNLAVRAYNYLKRSGITSVGQIGEYSDCELLSIRNFGVGCLRLARAAQGAVA